ncbi:MAG: glycosyl hydrolase 53 family protein [Candidatus Eisenbacteria bacterium]
MKRNERPLHAPVPVWLMSVVLFAFCGTSLAADVTFRVDMSTQVGHGLFDAASDLVVVRGTFNAWSGVVDVLSDPDTDHVYEFVLELTPGYYEYKYVIVPSVGPDRWESSIDNRVLTAVGDAVLDVVWFDDDETVLIPPQDTEVLFAVDMSREEASGRFDPGVDLVAVRGGHAALGDWTDDGVVLEREGAGLTYSVWVEFDGLTNFPVRHKFVVMNDGDPGDVTWENNIEDRSFVVIGDESDDLPPPDGNGYVEYVVGDAVFDHGAGWEPHEIVLGADLSFLPQLQSLGAEYSVDGAPGEPLGMFADHGFSLVRLRLWHTPAEPWHGLDATVAHAVAAKAAGHRLMLDLHYSDTWADPGHQSKPAAWEALAFPALVDSVYGYTNSVIGGFRDAGVLPDYVQIGNEITAGMLWDDGHVGGAWDTPQQWSQLGQLLAAGVSGVRDSLPEGEWPRIVIHVDSGGNNGACRWFFDGVTAEGVDFDVIGLSFYPWWHGTLGDLRANMHDLAARYGRRIMVVETAYPWTLEGNDSTGNFVDSSDDLHAGYDATPEGQEAFLTELMAIIESVPGGLGTGAAYWEPDYLTVPGGPGNPYENLTLFDFDGEALPALGFSIPTATSVPECDPDVGEGHGVAPSLKPPRPNPFESSTSLACEVPGGGARVSARVFDTSGRLVAVLADEFLEGGSHSLDWNGRDSSGRPVASGVYLFRLEARDQFAFSKVVLVR